MQIRLNISAVSGPRQCALLIWGCSVIKEVAFPWGTRSKQAQNTQVFWSYHSKTMDSCWTFALELCHPAQFGLMEWTDINNENKSPFFKSTDPYVYVSYSTMVLPLKLFSDFLFWSHLFLHFYLDNVQIFEWVISDNRWLSFGEASPVWPLWLFCSVDYSKIFWSIVILKNNLFWTYSLHEMDG